jgi:hypothetical protein
MFQPHLKYTLKFFQTFLSRARSFITTLFHSVYIFFSVLVKGLLDREHIGSQWGLQLIFRMHNSDPTPQSVENRNIEQRL